MPESSIVVKMNDQYSTAVKKMSDTTKAFSKDVTSMEAGLRALSRNKATLKLDLSKARAELRSAEKDFDGTEQALKRLGRAQVKLDHITREIKTVTDASKELEKQISKTQNRASGGGGSNSAALSVLSGFAASGLGDMAKDLALSFGSSFMTSAYGSDAGIMASSILSSAAAGAAIGTILPGIGNVAGFLIGALAGAGVGALNGDMQIREKKDDFFKEYYAGIVEDRQTAQEEAMSAGSETAGSREQDMIAFAKRLGGKDAAQAYLDEVKAMSASTNYSYDQITGYSKQLLNTYSPDGTFGVLQTLSDATAGLSLSESDVSIWISGLSRMRTTNKATMEYLNFFSERGLDVYEALAKGLKVDKTKIAGMVSKGQISGTKAAEILLDYMNEQYGGLSQDLMTTYVAIKDNLDDVTANVEAGYGDGYNEERKSGLGAKTASLEGKLGGQLTEVNGILGFKEGYAENVQDNYWLDIMEGIFTGDKQLREGVSFDETTQAKVDQYRSDYLAAYFRYFDAKENGDRQGMFEAATEIENIKKSAETMASEAFKVSDTNLILVDAEKELIAETRTLAAQFGAWAQEYDLQEEKTKGRNAAQTSAGASNTFLSAVPDLNGDGRKDSEEQVAYLNKLAGGRHIGHVPLGAWGIDYVPYDNYPALLHQGERVLTAEQARRADRGEVSVVISGNEFHIRQESDIDEVAEALLQKLQLAAVRG